MCVPALSGCMSYHSYVLDAFLFFLFFFRSFSESSSWQMAKRKGLDLVSLCVCVCVRACVRVCARVCLSVSVCVCFCVCVYVCIHMSMCTFEMLIKGNCCLPHVLKRNQCHHCIHAHIIGCTVMLFGVSLFAFFSGMRRGRNLQTLTEKQ